MTCVFHSPILSPSLSLSLSSFPSSFPPSLSLPPSLPLFHSCFISNLSPSLSLSPSFPLPPSPFSYPVNTPPQTNWGRFLPFPSLSLSGTLHTQPNRTVFRNTLHLLDKERQYKWLTVGHPRQGCGLSAILCSWEG